MIQITQSLITGKRSTVEVDSDEEDETIKPAKKRRVIKSDDSDNENDVAASSSKSTPKANKSSAIKRPLTSAQPSSSPKPQPKMAKKTPAKGKQSDDDDEDEPVAAEKEALLMVDSLNKVWLHETIDFLKPNQIKDKNMRKPNDPEYDPRTVFVPSDFIKKQSPGMRKFVLKCTIILLNINFSTSPVVEVEIRLFRLRLLLQSRQVLRVVPSRCGHRRQRAQLFIHGSKQRRPLGIP